MRQSSYNDEKALILKAVDGDKHAFGKLYDLYSGKIYQYCLYRLGSQMDAGDMTGTVFLKAWESLPSFGKRNGDMHFRAWLYRIAHNLIVDSYRQRDQEPEKESFFQELDNPLPVETVLEKNEMRDRLLHAVQKLDGPYQQVIYFRFIEEMSHRDTAQITGLTEANVRVIQYRALKKMREIFGDTHE